ncbi:hypothetical protein [Pseudomonas marincola]|uniref:hypothetical protein n=1 Tax=Pseudomonas marincola TaxID=437900 RepID=UPI0008E1059A|nr:hypothetical protein [Pseudomonas marincola]SFU07922.1 hypothetical protein SAMN05216264_110157 [Pseudomonas marincola]
MNPWSENLISTASFDNMPNAQLDAICHSAESQNMTLCQGVAAIGTVLAVAAQNEDAGLSMAAVADLGWLLESLGKLSAAITDQGNAARSYSDWHNAQKREG